MPYWYSDIPSKIFYASIGSEIFCIARKTTDLIHIAKCVNLLLIQMKKKQTNGCAHIILLLENIFGKNFESIS